MNDLQLALLGFGVLVIGLVVAYNAWQERKYRREVERRFEGSQGDALLGTRPKATAPEASGASDERIEPTVSLPRTEEPSLAEGGGERGTVTAAEARRAPVSGRGIDDEPLALDEAIHCSVRLTLSEPLPAARVAEAVEGSFPKPVRWAVQLQNGPWLDLGRGALDESVEAVVGSLQLADRTGSVDEETVADFFVHMERAAQRLLAVAVLPERQAVLARARALDDFCADVDVLLGVNVVSSGGSPFLGTKLQALAEAHGMRLAADGTFQYRDEAGRLLYALANQEPARFDAESLRSLRTHGVTLLFDVPRVPGGLMVFDEMMRFARQLADALKGRLVDDNLKALTEEGIAHIRGELAAIYARMEAQGVPAGSRRALSLFS